MRKLVPTAVLAAVVLSGLATPAFAAGSEPPAPGATVRERAPRHRPTGRLQVRFKDGVGAQRRDAALTAVTARGLSLQVDRRIPGLNVAVLKVSNARAVQALLRDHPDVAYVEPESSYEALQSEIPSPELAELGADSVHSSSSPNTGAGKQIAVLDSPVDAFNPDLNDGKVVFSANYAGGAETGSVACTAATCSHGTAVASAAAAQAGDGYMTGVAPGAGIRSYNVFRVYSSEEGSYVSARSADIAAALDAVKTHALADTNIVAVNLSLGGPFDNRLVQDAITALRTAAPHVLVVVAAGNDGSERANFPAGNAGVLSVGASGQVTGDDCGVVPAAGSPWQLAFFSNRGKVDVVAPGHCVNVWLPTSSGPAVVKASGTSFAAPMVAGVAALLAASSTPVTGDAARAAITAGAKDTAGLRIGEGAGAVSAPGALALAGGTAPYTALTTNRGGQVANLVGTRTYEVIRVEPAATAATTVPVPTVAAGYGTVSAGTTVATTGLARRTGKYSVATTTKSGTFGLTATGGAGDADTSVIPMRMLDAGDNFEGLPAAHGEAASVPLTYGTRSAYIRSAAIPSGGTLAYDFTYGEGVNDPGLLPSSDLFVWEPATAGGTADAAMEPSWFEGAPSQSASGSVQAGYDFCEFLGDDENDPAHYRTCRRGRYLVGFLTFSPEDNSSSTTRYALKMRYGTTAPTVALTAPAVAATSSVTGPFGVSWGGTRAVKWDVDYSVESRSGSTWTVGPWTSWKKGTTAKSATFGASGSPVTVTPGRSYRFRVRSYDALGNPTLYTTKVTSAPLDDRSGSISYSGFSNASGVSDRWQKTAKRATANGARAALSGQPKSLFTIVGDRCSTCGKFDVYLDGVKKATVDTYSSTTAVRRTLWTAPTRATRITIVVLGTANRPKVVLDGFGMVR